MYTYACLNNISEKGLAKFSKQYQQTEDLQKANGILVRSASMHGMELSDEVLAIARAGAGVNNIPIEDLAKKGIVVFNTPGANANGVKELVFAGMLLASRDIVEGVDWVRANWNNEDIAKVAEKEKKRFAGTELQGKKIGIIGLGAIGVQVANTAVNLGMKVYGYDPYVSVDSAWHLSSRIKHLIRIEDIYDLCDYITIHVPALPSTKGMIDEHAIEMMKTGVILINMARDSLVDEEAVVRALRAGKIRRYVSDFPNPTVAGRRGCITIPHLGASTEEAEDNCAVMAVEELSDYLENGNIKNSVNYPNCDLGKCETGNRISVFHVNKANMITQLTSIIGSSNVNIASMASKSKGEVEYTLFDLDNAPGEDLLTRIRAIPGVFRVREICRK
ncbi:MAG: 3-phosphoglycerate dehydrogenase family protein [Eubacteriales bacterium]|nr:3-phosphoglycerate dehydrogenase family protein [Eubacteriales bacterium]